MRNRLAIAPRFTSTPATTSGQTWVRSCRTANHATSRAAEITKAAIADQ